MNTRTGLCCIAGVVSLVVAASSAVQLRADGVKMLPPGESSSVPAGPINTVFNEYWTDDGHWVTEGLLDGKLCVTSYEVQNGIFKQVGRELRDLPPHPVFRGGEKVFQECASGVTLVQRTGREGSGIVISKDGLVLTNRHVVKDSPALSVSFFEVNHPDGHLLLFPARVVAADKARDLALVQIDHPPENLHVFELNAQLEVAIGADLFAIGHPLGLDWTFTPATAVQVRENYPWSYRFSKHKAKVIQFQAKTGPGNSGGPLLAKDGSLVGITTFDQGGQSFAVHVSELADFVAHKDDYPPSNIHDWSKVSNETLLQVPLSSSMHAEQCDFEDDGVIDLVRVDSNGDSQWDKMFLDVNGDAHFEFYATDDDEDGTFNVLYLDENGDGTPEYTFKGYPALVIPGAVELYRAP